MNFRLFAAAAVLLVGSFPQDAIGCTTDVTTMGVVGNGSTDNTSALNSLFSTIAATQFYLSPNNPTPTPCRSVYFPQGTYIVSGPITINASDITIYGDNRLTSVIQQKTANTPILQWTNESTSGSFGVVIHDLGLNFTTIPTTSSTSQWAVKFQCATTEGYGYALNSFERMAISNSYIGIGTPSGGNECAVWSSTFKNLLFTYTQHSAISLISPGGGLPSNLIDKVDILNYAENGVQLESDGPAIAVYESSGLVCRSINIENWYNLGYDFEGGKGTLIDQPRFERLHLTGGSPVLFYLGNNDFTVHNLAIESFAETSQSGVASIFSLGNGTSSGIANLDLSGAWVAPATLGTGAHVYMFKAPAPSYVRINDRGLLLQTGVLEYPPSATGSDEYSRVTTDGVPPYVDALPAAAVQYRGRMFTVLSSGSGVADVTYICLLTSGGTYVWHAI